MSCKVRLYFYDSNSGKNIFDEGCHLQINGINSEGETTQTAEELVFSHLDAFPGGDGYEFDKWSFSQTGVSFTPTNTDTLTQNIAEVPYLEVRCCLKPKTNPQPAKIVYNPNNGDGLIEQNVMFNDPATKLIDAPSYTYLYEDPDTHNTKEVIAVFAGWSTTETVEDADSITDEYTPGVAYEKYKKFWKVDFNGVKVYYQATEEMLSVKDPARPDVLVNTSWDDVKDYMFRLGANGAITYAALARYTPRALSTTMEAVWRRPTDPEDSSFLYPQGEIIYTDGPGEDANVIGRETAFGGVDVKVGDDGDFKGIAFDEWTDKSGKKVKKGSTIKTPSGGGSGGSGWSMHFHVSMAVTKKYWVRYDARGGKVQPEPQQVEPGYELTVAELPSKKDIHGQYTDKATCWKSGGSSYVGGEKVIVNSDMTFVTSYSKREVTVTYDAGKQGYVIDVDQRTQKAQVGGETKTKYAIPTVKDSKGNVVTPKEWRTGRNGKVVTPDTDITNPDDHKVTAYWTPKKTAYLNPNGGSIMEGPTEHTEEFAIELEIHTNPDTGEKWTDKVSDIYVPSRSGDAAKDAKDSDVWYTSSAMDAKTKYDNFDKKNANTNSIRLYVKWAQQVTFNANGGTLGGNIGKYCGYFAGKTYGAATGNEVSGLPTDADVTRDGYTFVAWYDKASGGNRVSASTSVSSSKARTLYARWAAQKQTVTFDPRGGKVYDGSNEMTPPTKEYDTSGKYDNLPIGVVRDKDGNETQLFDGWFTSAVGGTEVKNGDQVSSDETRTLYAHYTAKKSVVFHADGGYFTGPDGLKYSETHYFNIGSKYGELPTPSRDGGWSFKGWWTYSEGGTEVTTDTEVKETDSDYLHAHWENDKEVATLTYDYNGGVAYVGEKDVWKGDKAGALPLPRKDGETFTGWHKQGVALAMAKRDSGDVSGPLVTATTIIDGSMTLKASWSQKIFLYYAVAPQGN